MFNLKDCKVTSFSIQSNSNLGTVLSIITDDDRCILLHSEQCFNKDDYDYVVRVLDQRNEDDPDVWNDIVDQIKTYYSHCDIYIS